MIALIVAYLVNIRPILMKTFIFLFLSYRFFHQYLYIFFYGKTQGPKGSYIIFTIDTFISGTIYLTLVETNELTLLSAIQKSKI